MERLETFIQAALSILSYTQLCSPAFTWAIADVVLLAQTGSVVQDPIKENSIREARL